MLSIFTKPFTGGIHPKAYKELTNDQKIDGSFWPKNVYLSLQLRNGALLTPLVGVGDKVQRGQLLAVGKTDMIAPIHASVNGIVTAITPHVTSHPAKIKADTIIIRANDDRQWHALAPSSSIGSLLPEEVIERVKAAGIVGLGGAGFPTSAKLNFARKAKVHTLVINGGECEPYLTCDDLTMQTYPEEVIAGIKLMLLASGAEKAIVGVEDNKPEAYSALFFAASEEENITIQKVPSVYPMGSEKHLIKTLLNVEVPAGGLSTQIGILVNNIATTRAVYHAVRFHRPLTTRIVTVSGQGITTPKNVEVPIGTPANELIAYCDGLTPSAERIIFGGPMMGQVVTSPHVPIDKTVGGLLALASDEVVNHDNHQECIRCGQCVRACPMGLMPLHMAAQTRVSEFKRAEELGIANCLSCGACSYVCPSNIPLVQYFMHAKGVINANKARERKSQQAKALNEARKLRLEKEAQEKAAAKAAKAKRSANKPTRPARKSTSETSAETETRPTRPQRTPRNQNTTGNVVDVSSAKSTRPSRPARPTRPAREYQTDTDAIVTSRLSSNAQNDADDTTIPQRPARPARKPRVKAVDIQGVDND